MKKGEDQIRFVRNLRRRQTESEKLLWARLKSRQVAGVKFRRQQSIGTYIVDFASFERKLIVEIDGGQHNVKEAREKDEERTAWLKESGYRVLRFWNNDVMMNTEGVLERISEALV